MKLSAREFSWVEVCSVEQARELKILIDSQSEGRWFHRTRTYGRPTEGITEADYYFLGDKQQTPELNNYLREIAPVFKGLSLAEACVNRYLPGGYLPEHQDIHNFTFNIAAPIQADGDGISINGIFYPDQIGKGAVFGAISPPHKVPSVKNLRYTLIFLYE